MTCHALTLAMIVSRASTKQHSNSRELVNFVLKSLHLIGVLIPWASRLLGGAEQKCSIVICQGDILDSNTSRCLFLGRGALILDQKGIGACVVGKVAKQR